MAGTVLVVDDDASFLTLARQVLENAGLHVVGTAETAEDGLAAALALRPAAALVDVGLPDRSGIDLGRELASLPWAPRVLLTSTDRDALSGPGSDGAPAFVPKDELLKVPLRQLLLPD
jgi:DNA-binding NarL/FixJ family response regulator